ncbi:MAG: response regulator [Gemmatimonadaceae bacterium]
MAGARTYRTLNIASIVSYLLFVDDNEDMRSMVLDLLTANGYEVEVAHDGPRALSAVAVREPDLVILDLNMPGMSGLEVCRHLKHGPFTSRIPVLMLTARAEMETKIAGFDAGADDYLPKPFDPRELRTRVAALLRLVRREGDRNPTSGLPGGKAIDDELTRRAATGGSFALCYIDVDNFKPFCDTFGFTAADQVIRETGRALVEVLADAGDDGGFVGHIGGDDFIIVTRPELAEGIARSCATRFSDVVGAAVGADALQRGTFAGIDRDGTARQFPLARLTVAVLRVDSQRWVSAAHVGSMAAEIKRQAREKGAGTILVAAV